MMANAFVVIPTLTVTVVAATELWWHWTAHHHG